MAKQIDLRPIGEEHIRALCTFLDSMGISSEIALADFVPCKKLAFVFGHRPENYRARYIKLDGMNIDGIRYVIVQQIGGIALTGKWVAKCEYWVKCHLGRENKSLKNLLVDTMNLWVEAEIKRKEGEILDFQWTGGRIADVLNKDTSLKEPLLAELNTTHEGGNDFPMLVVTLPPLSDKKIGKQVKELTKALHKEGTEVDWANAVRIIRPIKQGFIIMGGPTRGHKDKISPLILPSEDAFRAYDKVAKHIKEYAATMR